MYVTCVTLTDLPPHPPDRDSSAPFLLSPLPCVPPDVSTGRGRTCSIQMCAHIPYIK